MHKKTKQAAHHAPDGATSVAQPAASTGAQEHSNGKPPSEELVRLRAYQKWEVAGKPAGQDLRFWLEAERELLQAR